jgi:predicted AAA+ superfamily ATPase
VPITNTLDLETLSARMNAWADERNSKRGRLVRAFRKNLGDSPDLQAARLALLIAEAA